jgi:hypothetical protein
MQFALRDEVDRDWRRQLTGLPFAHDSHHVMGQVGWVSVSRFTQHLISDTKQSG